MDHDGRAEFIRTGLLEGATFQIGRQVRCWMVGRVAGTVRGTYAHLKVASDFLGLYICTVRRQWAFEAWNCTV